MIGSITKKWKCASIAPPVVCTSIAEAVTSPSEAKIERCSCVRAPQAASAANTASGSRSSTVCSSPKPSSSPSATRPGRWAMSRAEIARWRGAQSAAGRPRSVANEVSMRMPA